MHSIRTNGRIGTLESPGQAESRTEAELTEASTSLSLLDRLWAPQPSDLVRSFQLKRNSPLSYVMSVFPVVLMWNLFV